MWSNIKGKIQDAATGNAGGNDSSSGGHGQKIGAQAGGAVAGERGASAGGTAGAYGEKVATDVAGGKSFMDAFKNNSPTG